MEQIEFVKSGLIRDSPDDCRSAMIIRVFSALLQDGREQRTATDNLGYPERLIVP